MLITKLGGLINRRVVHLPFSRSLQLDAADVRVIGTMMETCMRDGGVLLVQPEHGPREHLLWQQVSGKLAAVNSTLA